MHTQSVSFTGARRRSTSAIQCALKTCFKEGLFGDKVQFDIYGNRLKRKVTSANRVYTNASAEHIIPASKGGTFIALATKRANTAKKAKNIWEVLNNKTEEGRQNIMNAFKYLQQFIGIKIDTIDSKGNPLKFDGDSYIKNCNNVLRKVGIVPGNPDADIKFKKIKTVRVSSNRSFRPSQCRR